MLFENTLQFGVFLLVVMVTSVWSHGSHGTSPADHHDFDKETIQDKEHLKEHLKDQIEMDKSMTEEEMQFHYFKMHDYDNNNKLDGTEIVKAFTHHQTVDVTASVFSDQVLTGYIDQILTRDDYNGDGYIEYPEYIRSVRNVRAEHATSAGNV